MSRPTLRGERAKERTTVWIAEGGDGRYLPIDRIFTMIYLETEREVVITCTVIATPFTIGMPFESKRSGHDWMGPTGTNCMELRVIT